MHTAKPTLEQTSESTLVSARKIVSSQREKVLRASLCICIRSNFFVMHAISRIRTRTRQLAAKYMRQRCPNGLALACFPSTVHQGLESSDPRCRLKEGTMGIRGVCITRAARTPLLPLLLFSEHCAQPSLPCSQRRCVTRQPFKFDVQPCTLRA